MDRVRFSTDPTAPARAALVLKRIHSFDQAFKCRFDPLVGERLTVVMPPTDL